jgi:hypothetical protein
MARPTHLYLVTLGRPGMGEFADLLRRNQLPKDIDVEQVVVNVELYAENADDAFAKALLRYPGYTRVDETRI